MMRSPGRHHLVATLVVAAALVLATAASPATPPQPEQAPGFRFEVPDTSGMRWYKGNTHTHTTESDGDSPPEVVIDWYKEHGYNFLVLSDHNVLTAPERYTHLMSDDFILVAGEEVTSGFEGKAVHINGINVNDLVLAQRGESLVDTIQRNVDAIREVEGVPHINHPNFGWSFGAEELAQVENDRLLEIYNGHPTVHNDGGGDVLGMEAVWDYLLTRGKRIYGVAVDDAHHFQQFGPELSNPGRGWIAVKSAALEPLALMESVEKGLFYSSTGVTLDDVVVTERRLEIRIQPDRNFKYTTTFIGAGGRVLAESGENPAIFELSGPEIYVRALIRDSGGRRAWVQPVFVASGTR